MTDGLKRIEKEFGAFRSKVADCRDEASDMGDIRDAYGRFNRMRDRYKHEADKAHSLNPTETKALSKVFKEDVFIDSVGRIRGISEHVETGDDGSSLSGEVLLLRRFGVTRSPEKDTQRVCHHRNQPRHRLDPRFRELVEQIYVAMTARPSGQPRASARPEHFPGLGIGSILPSVSTNRLAGLMETVAAEPYGGKADLPIIASTLQKEVDDLFPIAETLLMLRFADVEGGDIRLTEAGKDFAAAEMDERKQLFRRQLLCYVPLAQHIRRVLDERASRTAPKSRFLDELEDYMTGESAEQTLRAVIDWARYAEAFAYDDEMATFSLENPT